MYSLFLGEPWLDDITTIGREGSSNAGMVIRQARFSGANILYSQVEYFLECSQGKGTSLGSQPTDRPDEKNTS